MRALAFLQEMVQVYRCKLIRIPSKLTLSITEQVIREAKRYAKDHGKSLSNIVEEYLKSLSTKKTKSKELELSELVNELKGAVKIPKDFKGYKTTLEDALIEKQLK